MALARGFIHVKVAAHLDHHRPEAGVAAEAGVRDHCPAERHIDADRVSVPTEEIDGEIIIPPGGCLSLSYLTTAAVGIASVTWVEVNE